MRLVPICLSENQNILALLILRHNWTCIYLHEFSRHSTSEQPTYTIIIDKTKTQNNNNNNSKYKFVCVKNLLPYLDKKIRFFSLLTAWNWCSWISSFFLELVGIVSTCKDDPGSSSFIGSTYNSFIICFQRLNEECVLMLIMHLISSSPWTRKDLQ